MAGGKEQGAGSDWQATGLQDNETIGL